MIGQSRMSREGVGFKVDEVCRVKFVGDIQVCLSGVETWGS